MTDRTRRAGPMDGTVMDEDKLHGPRFSLWMQGGEKHGKGYEIPPKGFVVGRAAGCNLILDDPVVSRQHARFYVEDEYCFVEDMGSRNGIRVNGRRVTKHILRSGDEVDLGCCSLVLRVEGSPTERPRSEKLMQLLDNIDALRKKRQSAEAAGPRQPPLHPFAIAAAVFAALACVFWAFALGAVLLGIFALLEIRSQSEHGGTLLAAAALVLGMAGALINVYPPAGVTLPRRPGDPLATECRNNLRFIGEALRRYAGDHDGRYPASLYELAPAYADQAILSCPGAAKYSAQHNSYAFPYAGMRDVPDGAAVVHDSSTENHEGRGGLVLYANGRVEWMNARDFEQLIASLKGQ